MKCGSGKMSMKMGTKSAKGYGKASGKTKMASGKKTTARRK